jgi:hypothetical protein
MGLMMAATAPWIEFAHHAIAPQHSFDGRVDMSVQTHDAASRRFSTFGCAVAFRPSGEWNDDDF